MPAPVVTAAPLVAVDPPKIRPPMVSLLPLRSSVAVTPAALPLTVTADALGKTSLATLQSAGYTVEWREYPMGHDVCMPEIQEISRWLQAVLGSGR